MTDEEWKRRIEAHDRQIETLLELAAAHDTQITAHDRQIGEIITILNKFSEQFATMAHLFEVQNERITRLEGKQ